MDISPDLAIDYRPGWLPVAEAQQLFGSLRDAMPWQQRAITLFGRQVMQPRLLLWMGDAPYTYSGVRNEPVPWTPIVADLKNKAEQSAGARFNSVLINYYRTGADSMGWHSDDEPELGANPVIASVSLGAVRRFVFRPRHRADKRRVALQLESGSLLVMRGNCQQHWQHAVPKTARPVGGRINLTFRWVHEE